MFFVPKCLCPKNSLLRYLNPKIKHFTQVWDIYWLFVLLRIVLAVIPTNSGYIHPDEHFQSVEVTQIQ